MIGRTMLLVGIFGLATGALTAQQPASAQVFTSAQAEAGKIAYDRTCGQCHTPSLMGRKGEPGELPPVSSLSVDYQGFIARVGSVPPLAGELFLERWGGLTAAQLIERFQVTADDPFFKFEDMEEETTVNITAYALQVSGAKAGSQPLTRMTDAIVNSITH